MELRPGPVQRFPHATLKELDELVAERVPELCMGDDVETLEETRRADALRPVNDLRGNSEVAWSNFFAERANGGKRDNETDTEGLQGSDICSSGDIGGRNGMSFAMASEESDECPSWRLRYYDGRTGFSPRLKNNMNSEFK